MKTADLIESQISEIRENVGYGNRFDKVPFSEQLVTEAQKVAGENYLFILKIMIRIGLYYHSWFCKSILEYIDCILDSIRIIRLDFNRIKL
jgi:hypothetical protein